MRGEDGFVVVSAGDVDVAEEGDIAGGAVVGDGVGAEDAVAEGDDNVAGGGVDIVVAGLRQVGFDDSGFGRCGRRKRYSVGDQAEIGRAGKALLGGAALGCR